MPAKVVISVISRLNNQRKSRISHVTFLKEDQRFSAGNKNVPYGTALGFAEKKEFHGIFPKE